MKIREIYSMGFTEIAKRLISKYFYRRLLKYPRLITKPIEAHIEPTNLCNLKCVFCPNKEIKNKGMMSLEDFKKIIDNIGHVKRVRLDLFGESLVNKDFFKMVRYCYEKGIKTEVDTNVMLLHNFKFDEIFGSGLDNITFAIDGATKETYEKYRIGGNFDQIVDNIINFCTEKKKRHAPKPTTHLQFVVMKQNKDEIPDVIKLAKEWGIDYLKLKSIHVLGKHSTEQKSELLTKWIPEKSRQSYKRKIKHICQFTFNNIAIGWNGDVVLCCEDFHNKYVLGNLLETPLMGVLRSKKYIRIRKKIINRKLDICTRCDAWSIRTEFINLKETNFSDENIKRICKKFKVI